MTPVLGVEREPTKTISEARETLLTTFSDDWGSDIAALKGVPWGKAMMWVFLLSDTFIFTCFLVGYMSVRMSTVEPWPNPSEVFALHAFGVSVPLLLIAIMTFVLISSSGAMAVNMGYQRRKEAATNLILVTALLGATFVGMQAFEWSKLILDEGVRPWTNPFGAPQFGAVFFMVTGFHGLHVSAGVIYLLTIAFRIRRGKYDESNFEIVEITGLYWHFVDLVWVFIFALFYLW